MLSSTRSGRSCPLWEQIFVKKESFLNKVKTYNQYEPSAASKSHAPGEPSAVNKSSTASKSSATKENPAASKPSTASGSDASSKSSEERFRELLEKMEYLCKDATRRSYLHKIGSTMNSQSSTNSLCKAWVSEIFPDWMSSGLKGQELATLLLTHLLTCSEDFIFQFTNEEFRNKCLGPLFEAVENVHKFPSCCDAVEWCSTTCLVGGLLYGQMAHPSFPVVNKLLRLSYTAKERQMSSDVFIFDKCRYVYEQFPSVDCSIFAISELHQQMVFRMVVDGLRKHLAAICYQDLFEFCNVAGLYPATSGGVSFWETSHHKFPVRQKVECLLFSKLKENGKRFVEAKNYNKAIGCYDKCQELCPKDASTYTNKAFCFLKLNKPTDALSTCNEALTLDPGNVKALYRRAMALKMLQDYSKAMEDLTKLLTKEDNKDAKRELDECQKLAVGP